jgi:hypothetical protein
MDIAGMCQCGWMLGTDPLGLPAFEAAFEDSQQVSKKSHHLGYHLFPHVHYCCCCHCCCCCCCCCCCYCFGEDARWMMISYVQITDDVCGYYLCYMRLYDLESFMRFAWISNVFLQSVIIVTRFLVLIAVTMTFSFTSCPLCLLGQNSGNYQKELNANTTKHRCLEEIYKYIWSTSMPFSSESISSAFCDLMPSSSLEVNWLLEEYANSIFRNEE